MTNKRRQLTPTLEAIAYIAIGILCCIFQTQLLDWTLTIIGALYAIYGIIQLVNKNVTQGIVYLAIGVIVILGGWLFLDIILLILGVVLVAFGVKQFIDKMKSKNVSQLISAIVIALIGLLLIVSKWAFVEWIFVLVGVISIIEGVLILIGKRK